MIKEPTGVLELGYFLDEDGDITGLDALRGAIDSGVILPRLWQVGGGQRPTDDLMEYTQYASFVEIPRAGDRLGEVGGWGLGFDQAFLQAQDVDPVQYVVIDDTPGDDTPHAPLLDSLQGMLEDWESFQYFRQQAGTALRALRDDPQKRDQVHQMVVHYTNNTLAYYEFVPQDTWQALQAQDTLKEWRATAPVRFSLTDVQTLYVPATADVTALRDQYPAYRGTFVVLR